MKKTGKLLFSRKGTAGLFLLALALLFGSGIGGARAALTYFSDTYTSRIQLEDIGVTLLENGEPVSWRNYDPDGEEWTEATGSLLSWMDDDEPFLPGMAYDEALSVYNSGTINQYVRVSIYKYWEPSEELAQGEGLQRQELDPSLIELNLLCDGTGYDNGWLLDEEASTDERTVLYYNRLLRSGEDQLYVSRTPDFSDRLTVSGKVADAVRQKTEQTADGYRLTNVYLYDGAEFRVEVEVDAVQEHSAEAAVASAWGRDVSIEGDVLSLE